MRNTTKLKHILSCYTLSIDITENGLFLITLVDKTDYELLHTIESATYSAAIAKAYSYFLKTGKKKLS